MRTAKPAVRDSARDGIADLAPAPAWIEPQLCKLVTKTEALNRQEFVVVGWTDPDGSRPELGSLLLGYYDGDGRLAYAGRAGIGITDAELKGLVGKLRPLATDKMPPHAAPPKNTRGKPLVLSRVHWGRPKLVAEVTYLTWVEDRLLRHVVYHGRREDKPARDVPRAG